jgi:hypothetical protein
VTTDPAGSAPALSVSNGSVFEEAISNVTQSLAGTSLFEGLSKNYYGDVKREIRLLELTTNFCTRISSLGQEEAKAFEGAGGNKPFRTTNPLWNLHGLMNTDLLMLGTQAKDDYRRITAEVDAAAELLETIGNTIATLVTTFKALLKENPMVFDDPELTKQAEEWNVYFIASRKQINDIQRGMWKVLAPSGAEKLNV